MGIEHESRLISGARELVAHEVLIVDGDEKVQRGMMQLLAPAGLHVTAVTDEAKALELVTAKFFGVVVIDLDTPTPGAGISLVQKVHERSPTSVVLVLSPRKSFDGAVAAFRAGAHDVVIKAPDQVDYLKTRIIDAAGDVATRGRTGTLLAELRDAMDEFLKLFMAAERRAVDLDDQVHGRDAARIDGDEEMRILVVDSDERLFKALSQPDVITGFGFVFAQTGGEALDRVTNSRFHIALVGPNVPDLPGSMVVKALKAQAPELILITYELGGKLQIVETTRNIPIVDRFTVATQLVSRLGELADAHRAKNRERRYLQAFRERHYDFLRRYAELKRKLDQAIEDA